MAESLGMYYVVMQRTFGESWDDNDAGIGTPVGGSCVKVVDTDLDLAMSVARDKTLAFLPTVNLWEYTYFRPLYSAKERQHIEAALATLPPEQRADGQPWATLRSWVAKKLIYPPDAPAAFYVALLPWVEDYFYYIEEVPM